MAEKIPWYHRKWAAPVLIALLLAGALLSVAAYFYFRQYVSTNDALIEGFRSTASTQVLGEIVDLRVDEGYVVEQGEVLCVLDDSVQQATLRQRLAELETAKTTLHLQEVLLEKVGDDYERFKQAFDRQIITQQQYDDSLHDFEAAHVRVRQAEADVEAAHAAVSVAEAALRHTVILSAIDGVVAKRWAFNGDVIDPGQSIVASYDLDSLWVTAFLNETDIYHVRIGNPVRISVDAFPHQRFEGKVFEIGAATGSQFSLIPPNNASGNFTKVTQRIPIKISVHEVMEDRSQLARLVPGLSVEVSIKVR